MFSILQVALDTQVWADPANPRFVEIVGPYKKWGGDNSDAFYMFAPLDPACTYKVRGIRGDAVYFSLTVYGGPRDGRYSERIVGTANDRMVDIDADGNFEFVLGPERPDGWDGAFIELDDDSVCAITRDYLVDPSVGRRLQWHIEALDVPDHVSRERRRPRPPVPRRRARGCASSRRWCRSSLGRAEHGRRSVPGTDADVRLGGGRRRVHDGQLRPRRRTRRS